MERSTKSKGTKRRSRAATRHTQKKQPGRAQTLIAVLASHDSTDKNNELKTVFDELFDDPNNYLKEFHFVFTGGTFERLVDPGTECCVGANARGYLLKNSTVLPGRKDGGVTILANLVVQRQCSIIWPFFSPITMHWLSPENLALMRLCDLWNAKRLMNAESVIGWHDHEAEQDFARNPQTVKPLTVQLGTGTPKDWPQTQPAEVPRSERGEKQYYRLDWQPSRGAKGFGQQTIALIAHDAVKPRIIDFAIQYESELAKFDRILATGTTGQEVESACRKLREKGQVRRCLSGPKGGDIEIAAEIFLGRCDVVVFFIDPLHPHPHIEDIRVVFTACMSENRRNNILMLTNEVHAREWIERTVRAK